MKKLIHRKGYEVLITSWENDGDYIQKSVIPVQNVTAAIIIAKFALLYKDELGDLFEPEKEELENLTKAYIKFIERYPMITSVFNEIGAGKSSIDLSVDLNLQMETVATFGMLMHERLMGYGDFYTRYCDSVEILYYENDVYAELVSID